MGDIYLPISALQHFAYCQRQFALIHLEQAWAENHFTSEGRVLHERVDEGYAEQRHNVRYERSVSLVSRRYGLIGKSDLIEVHRSEDDLPIKYIPVEYKRGKPKVGGWDRVQLCAQALCVEEMRATSISTGAIWYWQVRRREQVELDAPLRDATLAAIEGARSILNSGRTPRPVNDSRCRSCSLFDICRPKTFARDKTAAYVLNMYANNGDGE